MTTKTELERAVVEAARRFTNSLPTGGHGQAVINAVLRLEEYERSQAAAGISEGVAWNTIAVGDQVKGRTGFYPVTDVLALAAGKARLTIDVRGDHKVITRPTATEPTATVKRGPDGTAVQAFVDVFSSKEERA